MTNSSVDLETIITAVLGMTSLPAVQETTAPGGKGMISLKEVKER